jgi:hypothetical protein
MKPVVYIFSVLISIFSCNSNYTEKDRINDIIVYADGNNDSILLNLSICYRDRYPSEESKPVYFIHHDSIRNVVVNPHTFKQSLEYFLENATFDQIENFMKSRYGISSDIEVNYLEKSNQILGYIKKIGPIEITSDTVNLGHFIVYNVKPGLDLVHVYHSEKIYSSSWRTFFSQQKALTQNWYVRKYSE